MRIQDRYAARTKGRRTSIIRDLMKVATLPGMISLGGGYPSPKTFPVEQVTLNVWDGQVQLAGAELVTACQYGPSEGIAALIERILEWHHAKSGVELEPERLCVLNGSQEGLFALSYLFLDPGDTVALAEPTYPGAVAAFTAFTDNFLSIPQDRDGMKADALSEYVRRRERKGMSKPKFVYLNPNCQNPAGISMSPARRREILEVCERHDLLIVEDDPYELLKFRKADRHPTIQSMDEGDRVIRLDSFSKVFVPGLRVGYVSGPRDLIRDIRIYKQGANLHTSSFDQSVLATAMRQLGTSGLFGLIEKNVAFYAHNCQTLMDALESVLGSQVSYNRPDGGFFLWLELKESEGPIDTFEMIGTLAEQMGVLLIPGTGFSLTGQLRNCLRVSYSMQSPENLQEGVRRLGKMLGEYRKLREQQASGVERRTDG